MRHTASPRTALLALTLLGAVAAAHAAARKPQPLHGKLIRTIGSRVTVFYQYKTKDGKYHKAAAVSKTVLVKVIKPSKPVTP